uniref:NADH-ubiquinone oxidoreductase chain 4 n=1 Tax=Nuttalliella namaqua TaxID=1029659 RepID=K7QLX8_9ACAR|nr:NADH dehydrogenase subunit 4 [Nuttalliella namaqua]AFV32086.1 NADH dehydrogenase subunit 4 [Nuttalliella namaqua]
MMILLIGLLLMMGMIWVEWINLISGMMMMYFILMMMVMKSNMIFFNFIFGGDLMSWLMILLSLLISIYMMLSSVYSELVKSKFFLFCVFLMMILLLLCFISLNLLMFYVFFECVLIPLLLIILKWGNQSERLQAGMYMIIYTFFGSLPLLVMILFLKSSSLQYYFLKWEKFNLNGVMMMMLIVGFMIKLPIYFFHLWLPKAHVEAPVSGSMMLAGVMLKLGGYGFIRFKEFIELNLMEYNWFFISIGLVGGLYSGIQCMFQFDLKSMIAYSSICHMSLLFSGLMTMEKLCLWGGLLMMISHGFCSSSLFALSNSYYERFFSRKMFILRGLGMYFPLLCFYWFIFCVFNLAAPPSMNLASEIMLMVGLSCFSLLSLMLIIFLSFVNAYFSLFLFCYINHGKSWVINSIWGVSCLEMNLFLFHLIPLTFWVLKGECFWLWT